MTGAPPADNGITREQIADGLRRVGLQPGDRVMVHSSLKSFGHVVGGPRAVIGALTDVLTREGTLMMPSINYRIPFRQGGRGYYDPAETPARTGLISEVFRKTPGVCRSIHPTHPMAVRGRDAERYAARHHLTLTFGPDSPLGLLGREGGKALFLGTNYRSNTYKHVVEMSIGVPCLAPRCEQYPVRLPDGRVMPLRSYTWRGRTCPINEPNEPVFNEMDGRRLHVRGRIGESTITLFRYADNMDAIAGMLARGYGDHPPCSECPIRPGSTPRSVETDWDFDRGELKSDSPVGSLGPMFYRAPG